jgi:hypothetical protein
MKKLTPILNIYITANFLFEENKDGKIINTDISEIFKLIPFENLNRITKAVKGKFVPDKHQIQLFIPFNFDDNTVNASIIDHYPDELLFYIQLSDAEKFAYCGLPQKVQAGDILYLTPKDTASEYQINNYIISARPCSKGKLIAEADYILNIPADISRDQIQKILGSNISGTDDLKFVVGNKTVVLPKQKDLKLLHELLSSFINKKVSFLVKSNKDDVLIKDFSKVFITKTNLPADITGILSIPKSILKTDEKNYAAYASLNQFILHFPSLNARLNINIETKNFTASDKLFLDKESLSFTIASHPQLDKYKQVNCKVEDYSFYLYKQKHILMDSGSKKFKLPFDPILTYDVKNNSSEINITENNNK